MQADRGISSGPYSSECGPGPFFCRWRKRPQSDVQGRYFSFVHILFINWGPPVGPKPKIVSTFVLHEVPTSAAAGTGLKGNAVQNRDYARSCESPFSRPHILRHCPAGREGVRQGRVRRPGLGGDAIGPSGREGAATTFFQEFICYDDGFRALCRASRAFSPPAASCDGKTLRINT